MLKFNFKEIIVLMISVIILNFVSLGICNASPGIFNFPSDIENQGEENERYENNIKELIYWLYDCEASDSLIDEDYFINAKKEIPLLIKSGEFPINSIIDKDGDRIIHLVAWMDEPVLMKFLFKQPGIELNATNNRGENAFHTACFYSNESIIYSIIENKKIDINAIDKNGCTGLDIIFENGNENLEEILMALLEAGGIFNKYKKKE